MLIKERAGCFPCLLAGSLWREKGVIRKDTWPKRRSVHEGSNQLLPVEQGVLREALGQRLKERRAKETKA